MIGASRISKPVKVVLLFSLAVAPGFADLTLYHGTFAADGQVALFNFTVNTSELVTFQTYSYAGGTANSVIPAGGFAPTAFLFDNIGDVQTLNSGSCSQAGTDPVAGLCDDLYFQDLLGPGTYTFALAVYDNTLVNTSVADGFVEDGNPGFTCQEAGASGNFCDLATVLGTSRTCKYAVSIAVESAAVPEPSLSSLSFCC